VSSASAQDFVQGELLIKLRGKSSSVASNQFFGKMQGKMSLKASFGALNIHKFQLKAGADVWATINELRNDPAIDYVEPNYFLKKFDDSMASSQSYSDSDVEALLQPGDSYSQSYANVHVNQAWAQEKTLAQNPERPIVAIVDTGVDYNHKIFQQSGAMWVNPGEIAGNGVDDDGNGYIDDVYGYNFHDHNANPMDNDEHGTHCAGIVLGVGQDIFATTLEPARIRIMALKFLGADGSGSTGDAVSAIYYAVNNGASVINNSWGGSNYSQSLHDALIYAYNHHVLIASAAGNYSSNNDAVSMYPSNYPVPGQISIAASNDSDNLASFSNFGANSVHLAAPGVSILSSIPGNQYRFMSGTSMATPFAAGLAALAIREAPGLTGYQIKNLLINSSVLTNSLTGKVSSRGRADAYNAVMAAKSEVSTSGFQPDYKDAGRAVASADASVGAKGCGTVSSALIAGSQGAGPTTPGQTVAIIVAFTLLPLIAWQFARSRKLQTSRRRHDRFLMSSAIRLSVEGRELIGHMRTISEGGLSFEANTMLEKGGIVKIQIQSPDGTETVQVDGHIVWSEQNKAYGVQFDEAKDTALSSIRGWTNRLVRVANY
jgi:subtilisin family serine protease